MSDSLEHLAKSNFSFSPGFSLGIRGRMKLWNRFNGFRKLSVVLDKPLKRLTTFPSRPKPQAEAWGE
jgi:hypothetical protein